MFDNIEQKTFKYLERFWLKYRWLLNGTKEEVVLWLHERWAPPRSAGGTFHLLRESGLCRAFEKAKR